MKAGIRKFAKPLSDLIARDANEGDTRLLVTDFLSDVLGYVKYEDLTTEYQVKGEFADYGVRIDKQLVAFIEVKRVATKLGVKHLRQVEMYAFNERVEWMVLTNGAVWQVYHLTGGLPVVIDLAFDVDQPRSSHHPSVCAHFAKSLRAHRRQLQTGRASPGCAAISRGDLARRSSSRRSGRRATRGGDGDCAPAGRCGAPRRHDPRRDHAGRGCGSGIEATAAGARVVRG